MTEVFYSLCDVTLLSLLITITRLSYCHFSFTLASLLIAHTVLFYSLLQLCYRL